MTHIMDIHTKCGDVAKQSGKKDLFPENMTNLEKIEICYARNLENISALESLRNKHEIKYITLPNKFRT